MKKTLLFTAISLIISSISFSQEKNVYPPKSASKVSAATVVTEAPAQSDVKESLALKPADGQPATFSSQADLETAVPMKTASIKEMINSGKYDDARLQVLREELWRFENAVVIKK